MPGSDRLLQLQYNLKLCWCHRMTVSGLRTRAGQVEEPKRRKPDISLSTNSDILNAVLQTLDAKRPLVDNPSLFAHL